MVNRRSFRLTLIVFMLSPTLNKCFFKSEIFTTFNNIWYLIEKGLHLYILSYTSLTQHFPLPTFQIKKTSTLKFNLNIKVITTIL